MMPLTNLQEITALLGFKVEEVKMNATKLKRHCNYPNAVSIVWVISRVIRGHYIPPGMIEVFPAVHYKSIKHFILIVVGECQVDG